MNILYASVILLVHCSLAAVPLCSNDNFYAGCMREVYLKEVETNSVNLREINDQAPPIVCSKICKITDPESDIALIIRTNDSLDCHCAQAEEFTGNNFLGPLGWCNKQCPGFPDYSCGGTYTFKDDNISENFYSLYCIDKSPVTSSSLNSSTRQGPISSTTLKPIKGDNTEDEELLLQRIWNAIVEANVTSIVIIGLLITVLILLLVLFVWAYTFISYGGDPLNGNKSAFYRKLSEKHGLKGDSTTNNNYGGTDNAAYVNETRNEDLSTTSPPVSDESYNDFPESHEKAGKSTFYNGSSMP